MFKTFIGSMQLPTPLLLASGYITETPEFFLKAQPLGCVGMVTRSLKMHVPPERARVPAPRYAIYEQRSMLNCEWGNERPWEEWYLHGVREVRRTGGKLILSLSGRDVNSCAALIKKFVQIGVDAFEINISCSHSGALHGNLNIDPEHIRTVMNMIRPLTTTQIWIKLAYSTMIVAMAKEAEALGADAIVCTNSVGPGMLIDTESATSKLGIRGGGGGLTGDAIFPIALWCVNKLYEALDIPVIGCGGISNGDHAIQMLMAGASALELYTAPALKGPKAFRRIMSDMQRFFKSHPKYNGVRDLIGIANQREVHQFSAPAPIVIKSKCTGCGICEPSCAFGALKMVDRNENGLHKVAVITDSCVGCNACVGVCPPKFSAITTRY